ncbi:uncharacterized protein [Ptychodera flava]|uniref:uncharacterized protein n=1 Tax=Ptychodera flava TaxID=63121 RepID=UPI00396A27BC
MKPIVDFGDGVAVQPIGYRSSSRWQYRLVHTYYLGTCEVFCDTGEPECECEELPNCDTGQRRCTSKDDHRCLKCEHDYGGDLKAYALLSRNQSVDPYIVQDGVCQLDNYAVPLQCLAQVMRVEGENVIDKVEAECMRLHEQTKYVNDPGINRIEMKLTTFFRGAERYPTMPVLLLSTSIKNGGYLDTVGFPDVNQTDRTYYEGRIFNTSASFTFDFDEPYHCFLETSCDASSLLERDQPYTKEILPMKELEYLTEATNPQKNKAGNPENAMRYLMFDNVNTPHIDNTGHYPIRVESAAQNTSYTWITKSDSKVEVHWYRHFLNEFHKNTGQLDAINDYSLDILPAYDEMTGQPPDTRSREAIPNAHGIIKFVVAFGVDQQGGMSLTGPTRWYSVDNVEAEIVELDINYRDGDTIRIWIKGSDVMENTVEDNVTVHSDSTPPEIGEMYLTRNGVDYLAVHNSEDLYEMMYFTIEMNKELMSIPIGIHDYDYVFSVTVTNNAMLQSTRNFQITVDNSPPREGSVHDSLPDYPDVDFQQSLVIFASWDGFFDRESGVMLYAYYFGRDCLYDNEIQFPIQEPLFTATSTQAEWTAPSPGRYFCSVIAYNRAMEPSKPVCSDGVTIDVSEPIITDIIFDDVFVRPGLVNDGDGTVWFIDQQRYRQELSFKWQGEDAESGIYDYEVGLSSVPSGLIPDILPFTSTKSNPAFLTYHPNLGEGVEFYVVIKAINRAGLVTNEFLGPLVVEVTPPEFDGEITVTLEDDDHGNSYLVARWSQDAFYDDDDLDPLEDYQVAVGEIQGDSWIMPYVPVSTLEIDICEVTVPPSCVAVPTDMLDWHLHGEQTYYISFKVTNVAGLSVVASSLPYRHIVLLPREGVVYDITLPDEAGVSFKNFEDIDFQTSVTDFHCWWTGFSHPHQGVQYRVALGSLPGSDNVVNFTDVDSSVSTYSFQGLTLNVYQRYFVTVEAESELGSVSVSSDGVMVISDGDSLTNAHVYDGQSCGSNDTAIGDSIHHDYDKRKSCLDDINFQASVTTVNAHWTVPENMTDYITELKWALQSELIQNSTVKMWDFVVEYMPVYGESDIPVTGMTLRPGGKYRSSMKFCHPAGCFKPIVSSGFWVTPYQPIPFGIDEVIYDGALRDLSFTWKSFQQEELDEEITEDAIDYYEWSINVMTADEDTQDGHLILPWQRIDSTHMSGQLQYTTMLAVELDFSDCLRLGLRGYNKAGLSSTIYKEIKDCNVIGHITKNIIIDAVGEYDDGIEDVRDVELSEDSEWKNSDAEYTRSKHKLSAVWPNLGHGNFSWKVISDQTLDRYAYQKPVQQIVYDSYECSSPDVEACGETNSQYVNVDGLQLEHGWRYYICMHANETVMYDGNFEVILPEVSACSDGIVADHTPPTVGTVRIGREGQQYQTSSSSLIVHWEGFYDVEEHGRTSHGTGIKKYEIAIGSFPGGVDVQDYQSVGILNWVVVTGLNLQGGLTYYAAARATDYVGLTSQAVSVGVTIDVTPPMTSDRSIDFGGHFLTSTSSIAATWNGIAEYEWCVGSNPLNSDVYPCTTTEKQPSIQSDEDLELIEGHSNYVMVKAYNGAGLSTAAVSWGVLVDASPPRDGFVYDGDDKNVDQDYQTHLDYLAVHWGGFYDPHSSIAGYSLKIGTCLNCDDVMKGDDVGLSLEMRFSNLNLEPGIRYYTTVTACNAAGLCTTVTSDGIIPDNSPPIAGKVYDGVSHGDQAFQSSRTSLSAHWYNFHDPHSQLSHYELQAGTTPGGNDTLPRTRLHLTEKAFISQLPNQLQIATPIYVTVRAFNKAGLFTEQSSNGIIVDDTPPTLIKKPRCDNTMGSIFNGTQVQGNLHQYTFTNLSLHDGNTYFVHVIVCNAAKLCTSSDTDDILVDSSPPTVGTFAVETDHAAGLTRHQEGWMTYHQSQGQNSANVKLAWLGFADIHTGIRHYHVGVGSRYASCDVTGNITVQVPHSNGTSHFDEGSIQTAIIDINRDLVPGEYIYCSLWAVNEVQ